MKHRIQKLLAQANLGSRRATEEYITAGRVRVNGQVAQLGAKADPETDVITVDGERLNLKTLPRYIMYYKPVNVLSTSERQPGDDRPTVREMVPVEGHLFTIGRLDVESEGLVILTNDGELANRLAHPRYEHTKTYKVTVYGEPSQQTLDTWERGILLPDEDSLTAPCSIRVQEEGGGQTTLRIVMTEGRNRQIRRVAAALGHPVKRLMRTHIGKLGIGTLRKGEWIDLTAEDLRELTSPHSEIEYIGKLKKANAARDRRSNLMKYTTASPEQLESARKNRQEPLLPRKPKKAHTEERATGGGDVARRRPQRDSDYGDEDRPRRPVRRTPDQGKRDGRPGGRPAFRSRLAIDETGGRPVRPQRAAPEGFRSRLSDDERPRQERRSTSSLMRDETGREDSRPRRSLVRDETGRGSDRPRRPYNSEGRGGDSRPPRREGGDDRPRRPYNAEGRGGDSRPPRREGGSDDRPRRPYNAEGRGGGDSRPPRREGGDDRPRRPYNAEGRGGDSRPPRREGGDDRPRRPYNAEGRGGDSRPPRREGGDDRPRRPYNAEGRGGDSRPPRREGGDDRPRRPYNAEGRGGGDSRPPRREGGDDRPRRPYNAEGRGGGDSRPPRREGGDDRSRRPYNSEGRGGDSRPPRREGGDDRPRRPYNAEGRAGGSDSRPPRREGGDDRPRRPYNSEGRGGGDSRPPRREGDSRPPRREGSSDDRPRRPASSSSRPAGSGGQRRDGGSGDSRPARRTTTNTRPPRRDGGGDSRPATKRRKDDDE